MPTTSALAQQTTEVTSSQSIVLLRNLMRLSYSSVLCACAAARARRRGSTVAKDTAAS